jgi:hypothetical protein
MFVINQQFMTEKQHELTATESLNLITEMINRAKGNVQQNSFYFLFWGWIIFIANVGVFTLISLHIKNPYAVWAITIPAWIVSLYRGFTEKNKQRVSSHLDSISGNLWVAFGVCVFTIVAFGYKLNFQLNPLILIISSIPTFLSGVIIRFKPLMYGAVAFWLGGVIGFLMPMQYQPLIGAFVILIGYLIPGYLLKAKTSHV